MRDISTKSVLISTPRAATCSQLDAANTMVLATSVLRTFFLFFFQAEDGIRDLTVTGVQTCALPIYAPGGAARGVEVVGVVRHVPQRRPVPYEHRAGADRLEEGLVVVDGDRVGAFDPDRKSVV